MDFHSRGHGSARMLVGSLVAAQMEVLVRAAFLRWHDASGQRAEGEAEAVPADAASLAGSGVNLLQIESALQQFELREASSRGMLATMFSLQLEQLIFCAFAVWRDLLEHNKELSHLRGRLQESERSSPKLASPPSVLQREPVSVKSTQPAAELRRLLDGSDSEES